jgi:hypothetical protein
LSTHSLNPLDGSNPLLGQIVDFANPFNDGDGKSSISDSMSGITGTLGSLAGGYLGGLGGAVVGNVAGNFLGGVTKDFIDGFGNAGHQSSCGVSDCYSKC